MDANKKQAIMEAKTFDDLLNAEYGKVGTPARDQYEDDAQAFCLAECLKAERKRAGLTQEQLADRQVLSVRPLKKYRIQGNACRY